MPHLNTTDVTGAPLTRKTHAKPNSASMHPPPVPPTAGRPPPRRGEVMLRSHRCSLKTSTARIAHITYFDSGRTRRLSAVAIAGLEALTPCNNYYGDAGGRLRRRMNHRPKPTRPIARITAPLTWIHADRSTILCSKAECSSSVSGIAPMY